MSDVHHRGRTGQGSDPSTARACLARFVDAARELGDAWHPILEQPTYPAYFPPFPELLPILIEWRADVEARIANSDPNTTEPVDFSDPTAVRSWLTALTIQIEDIAAAAEDATRPPDRRRLGRALARSMIIEARVALVRILQAAERSLPGADPEPPEGTATP